MNRLCIGRYGKAVSGGALTLVTISLFSLGLSYQAAEAPRGRSPGFDGDRAFADLERLVGFGPRPSGSAEYRQAQEFLEQALATTGLEVERDDFTARTPVGPIRMSNLIAIHRGSPDKMILVAGHYDTKRFDHFDFVGANDGGSSAAVIVELARAVARIEPPPAATIWLVLLDGEEAVIRWSDTDSLYGSRHLASRMEASGELRRVVAFLLVDMIGDRELGIQRDMYSTPWLRDMVWATAARLGHSEYFLDSRTYIQDDHLPFAQRGVPVVDLIDFQYGPANRYWHSREDTLDKVSPHSLKVVGETVLAVLGELGGPPSE